MTFDRLAFATLGLRRGGVVNQLLYSEKPVKVTLITAETVSVKLQAPPLVRVKVNHD